MKKAKLVLATLMAAGLVAAPLAAEAGSYKTKKQGSSMSSTTTTGANVKPSKKTSKKPSGQGNVGAGASQGGSTSSGY